MRLTLVLLIVVVALQGCAIKQLNKTDRLQNQALDLLVTGNAPHAEPR